MLPVDKVVFPPAKGIFSMTITDAPLSAAATAADNPAPPAPTTTTSTA